MAAEILSVGLIVTHKTWGLGKVVHLDPQNAWVYFRALVSHSFRSTRVPVADGRGLAARAW